MMPYRFLLLLLILVVHSTRLPAQTAAKVEIEGAGQGRAPAAVGSQEIALTLIVPDTLYIGLTRVGRCDTVTLPLQNRGSEALVIDTLFLNDWRPSGTLEVLEPLPTQLGIGETIQLRIAFCPVASGCIDNVLLIYAHGLTTLTSSSHSTGVHACAGRAVLNVDRTVIDFGDIPAGSAKHDSIIITNPGDFPLEISETSLLQGQMFTILDGGFPLTLSPGEGRKVRLQFAPQRAGAYEDSLVFTCNADTPAPRIYLVGRAHTPEFTFPEVIEFDDLAIGACRDTIILLRNNSEGPQALNSLPLPGSNGAFEWLEPVPSSLPLTIQPGDTVRVRLRFCARDTGRVSEEDEILIDVVRLRVSLRGHGVVPALRLDTAWSAPGRIARLTFRLAPGLRGIPIGSYVIRMQVDPAALSPIRAGLLNGTANAIIDFESDGSMTITGNNSGRVMNQEVLAQIELRGLSTGKAFNFVDLLEATVAEVNTVDSNVDGGVFLEGCEIAHPVSFGPRLAIRAVRKEGPGELSVTYVAPEGTPVLSLFDMAGKLLLTQELPPGTGGAQQVRVVVNHPAGEPCFIELRRGSERTVVPVALAR